ncbi:MAG: adenylate/guanylate cyclase domain-containing protein [Planctomycetota bacterium]
MPDLIAQGTAADRRWRKPLPDLASGRGVALGREPVSSVGAGTPTIAWAIPWDRFISRHHALLMARSGDRIEVTRDERSQNPIFYRGRPRDTFTLVPGEHFVIGETTFTLARRPGIAETPEPGTANLTEEKSITEASEAAATPMQPDSMSASDLVTEWAFKEASLRNRSFRDADSRIEMLAALPDLVSGSVHEDELLARVTDVLMRATASATAVAIVSVDPASTDASAIGRPRATAMRVLHFDTRTDSTTTPSISSRLVSRAVQGRESVLHVWEATPESAPEFTVAENVDWAFCVPLRSQACAGWALYVTGTRVDTQPLQSHVSDTDMVEQLSDDVKFAEVVGSLVAGMRQSGQLQQQQSAMRQFFAPVVLEALADEDAPTWLQPQDCDLTVMFCDLRGFSGTSESRSHELLLLLEQVSGALGVMTRHILDTGGVIGDFHGDAAMGFWGWPLPMGVGDDKANFASARAAANAALGIRRDDVTSPSSFRCGIGLASGPAVAGRIGTVDQVKVTAFGPVVNLASRLEGLTKAFGVEVLMDQVTADRLSPPDAMAPEDQTLRLRQLGRVRVAGMKTPVVVSQLIIPTADQTLTREQIQTYHSAWEAFAEGRWDDAYEGLHELPAWDRPKDVLMRTILQHHRIAPADWDGVLDFPKS